jgi:pimeloyl-ACP methyl ester carboxylesterase
MYPNEKSINALCEVHAPRDPRAQKWARLEVIDGINRWGFLSVDRINCIDSRFLKAIQYLASTNPSASWGTFLKRGQIDWEKVVVAGHSQGGGMAGVIAKTRNVRRCVMFASMDYWEAGKRPCNWMLERPRTPVERWYFLAHERDQILDFAKMKVSATGLGLEPFGPFVPVESATDPAFGGTRCLSTNIDPASIASTSFHGSVLVNPALARNADGLPALKPAWDYMLLHNNSPVNR